MSVAILTTKNNPIFISEIFLLSSSNVHLAGFRLTPNVSNESKDIGNRLGFHLSRRFPHVVVIFHKGNFIALAKEAKFLPEQSKWREALEIIRTEVQDLSDRPWSIQWIRQPQLSSDVTSRLACQILQTHCQFSRRSVSITGQNSEKLLIRRDITFKSELIELEKQLTPAISLSLHSNILYRGNLADFFQSHPARHQPEKLLIGIHVQSLETFGHGIIRGICGKISDKRDELLQYATASTSKQALREAPDDQPLVGIQFGRNPKIYEYAMAALKPRITDDTDERFGVEYGQILRSTKISFQERKELLAKYRLESEATLSSFGLSLSRSINSNGYPSLFWNPVTPTDQTPLLFGNNFVSKQSQILRGLKNGGVYRQHPHFINQTIHVAAVSLCKTRAGDVLGRIESCLKGYGFKVQVVDTKKLNIDSDGTKARADLEKTLNKIAAISPDLVIIFLPESDRSADKSDGGSLYQFAYAQLLRRQIASQFIYEDTLQRVQSSQILNQVVPGILAKLGNLPFVLKEPLEIADYFIGLDISRATKSRLAGTMNACASIRLYGKQGEFIRYQLEDAFIEGEEIPQRMLERLLPAG